MKRLMKVMPIIAILLSVSANAWAQEGSYDDNASGYEGEIVYEAPDNASAESNDLLDDGYLSEANLPSGSVEIPQYMKKSIFKYLSPIWLFFFDKKIGIEPKTHELTPFF